MRQNSAGKTLPTAIQLGLNLKVKEAFEPRPGESAKRVFGFFGKFKSGKAASFYSGSPLMTLFILAMMPRRERPLRICLAHTVNRASISLTE